MTPVTDPALLAMLNGEDTGGGSPAGLPVQAAEGLQPVTDPALLAQLNGGSPGIGGTALDVAKQIGSGIVTGTEGAAAGPAIIADLAGKGVDFLAPGLADPARAKEQADLKALIAKNRNGGIAQYLPEPQTQLGQSARNAAEIATQIVGNRGGIARNVAAGVGAGVGSETARRVAEDTQYEIPAALVGLVAGGGAGLKSAAALEARAAGKALPAAKEILADSSKHYQSIADAGTSVRVPQADLEGLTTKIRDQLFREGPRPSRAPGVDRALDEITNPGHGRAADINDLVGARQNMKGFLGDIGPDKAAAAKALPHIDAEIKRLDPLVWQELQKADRGYSTGKISEAVNKRLNRAEMQAGRANSGGNLGNRIRTNVDQFLESSASRGILPDERALLERVTKGGAIVNRLRSIGNSFGGSGIAFPAIGLGTAGTAHGLGLDSETSAGLAALIAAVGKTSRYLGNRSTMKAAKAVDQMVRARSPLALSLDLPRPNPIPLPQLGGVAALSAGRIAAPLALGFPQPQR